VVEPTLDFKERIGVFLVGVGIEAVIAGVSDGFEVNEAM
jgi:hypothetical protein